MKPAHRSLTVRFFWFVFKRSDDKLITGFASAKSAEGSPGRQTAGEIPKTENQKADAPAKSAGEAQNPSMKAKHQNPKADDEATPYPEEELEDVLSDFHPAELEDWDGSGVPDWVYVRPLIRRRRIRRCRVRVFAAKLRRDGGRGSGPRSLPWSAKHSRRNRTALVEPWTASTLRT